MKNYKDNNRVLFVNAALYNSKYSYAGLEKMFVWVANSLANEGVDVSICTFYDKEKSPKILPTVNTICLGAEYSEKFFKRTVLLFTSIRKKLKKIINKYDTVVTFGDISFFVVMSLNPIKKFRFVTSERGDPNNKGSMLSRLGLKLFRYVDAVVFQSYGAQSFFSEKIRNKSYVIPNSIEIPVEQWNGNVVRGHIASVGRVDFWQKRLDVLVSAFSIVLKTHPEYVLDIYGDGELQRLENLCKEHLVEKNVIIHGVSNRINEKLLESDLFVITSDFEGIPNALLEAMALGMPVVSTDCSPGGAAMLIDNGVNGFLVQKGDAKQVADAIIKLIENRQLSIEFAQKARIKMKEFEPKKIILLWKKAICPK